MCCQLNFFGCFNTIDKQQLVGVAERQQLVGQAIRREPVTRTQVARTKVSTVDSEDITAFLATSTVFDCCMIGCWKLAFQISSIV